MEGKELPTHLGVMEGKRKRCRYLNKNANSTTILTVARIIKKLQSVKVQIVSFESKLEDTEFKCVSRKDCWTEQNLVVEHKPINHMIYFCINCDQEWSLMDERDILEEICKVDN